MLSNKAHELTTMVAKTTSDSYADMQDDKTRDNEQQEDQAVLQTPGNNSTATSRTFGCGATYKNPDSPESQGTYETVSRMNTAALAEWMESLGADADTIAVIIGQHMTG